LKGKRRAAERIILVIHLLCTTNDDGIACVRVQIEMEDEEMACTVIVITIKAAMILVLIDRTTLTKHYLWATET